MKIAWLCPYPVQEMGSEIEWFIRKETFHSCGWIVNLQNALVQMPDVELHIVVLHPGVKRTQCVRQGGAFIHVVKNGIPALHRGWPGTIPADVFSGFLQDIWLLKREVNRIQPDLVHGHGTESAYALAATGMCFPAVISMQGIIAEINKVNPTWRFCAVERLERKALRRATYVSCRTAFDTGFVREMNPKAHIFQIQEAMSPHYFKNQWTGCEQKRILFVGSMGKHKGLEYLLQATAALVSEDSAIELCIVGGTPPQIEACRQRCRELGIGSHIEFTGFLKTEDIPRYHLSSSVFVIPSTNENSPNTLAEAMVSGMPCVASAVGGIPSMVAHEKTGLLFNSADVADMVRALKRVLYDRELGRKLGAAAAKIARARHKPEAVAQATVAAYQCILDDVKLRSGAYTRFQRSATRGIE